MKSFRRTQSSFSTNINTPAVGTPSQSHHLNPMTPLVLKERLRIRLKQQPAKQQKYKTYRKQKYRPSIGQIRHNSEVNWIIFNMLVGIYHNWLRLSPCLFYLLTSTRRSQIEDLQEMIANATKQKAKILEMLRNYKVRNSFEERNQPFGFKVAEQSIDELLLKKIQMICNEVKVSTHIFNGEILAKKRVLKTEKENILADQLMQIGKSNNINMNQVKMLLQGDGVSKVAESIIDRIEIVKYMRKNKIKIDENILRPLKSIFKSQKNFDYEQQSITTANIIEKIKSKFAGIGASKPRNPESNQINQNLGDKNTRNQDESASENDHIQLRYSLNNPGQQRQQIDESGNASGIGKNFQFNIKLKSRKKIGFIQQDEEEWQRKIRDSYNGDKIKKKNQEIYNQRKVVLNRSLQRSNVKTVLTNLKNQFQHKKEIANSIQTQTPNLEQVNPQQKHHSKKKILEKGKRKMDKNFNQKQKQQFSKKNARKSLGKSSDNEDISSMQKIQKEENNFDSSQSQDSTINEKSTINRSRKYLKPARLLRKKKLKKSTNLFDKISLENFDLELKAEDNVLNKKKKIVSLLSQLEASGLINTKSINKVVSNYKKFNLRINDFTGRNNVRRLKSNGQYPVTSFFMICLPQEKEAEQKKVEECLPYNFLTAFNKEALLNWRHKQYHPDVQISKAEGMDYDLNPVKVSKDADKKVGRWVDKQNVAIQMGLTLIRQIDQMVIQQKGVDSGKGQDCI